MKNRATDNYRENKDTSEVKSMPLIGDKFPQIKAKTTHGNMNLPEDLSGKWMVLFSHPGDFTPVCTTEFVSFAKKNEAFKRLNTELVGLSIDQVFSHIKWTEWIKENLDTKIPFPIIADDRGQIAEILRMLHPGKGNNTVRAVFITDPDSIIRAMLYYPQELGRNMDEILRMVKGLQKADQEKVAIPANWPENEILKEKVIPPPAADEKTAQKRRGRKNCYDWWFCYKN